MQMDDSDGGSVILPADEFWLLNVRVKAGEQTPFVALMLYDYQWLAARRSALAETILPDTQADGVP